MKAVEDAKASLAQAKGQLEHAFAHVPDERLNWSPAPTARTAIQQVAHVAEALHHIVEMLDGRQTLAEAETAAADRGFREWEGRFSTRSEVLELFEQKIQAYNAFLDSLTPERLETDIIVLPFRLGTMPLALALGAGADHTRWHAAQINYIQTIYGDRDWHL